MHVCISVYNVHVTLLHTHMHTHIHTHTQLQDAAKKKFTKCEHIDVDWGVGDQEEDIYQTPLVDMQPPEGGMKKSETTGNIAGGGLYTLTKYQLHTWLP